MDKTTALKVIGSAMEAATAAGEPALRGQLATLYYKVAATDFGPEYRWGQTPA